MEEILERTGISACDVLDLPTLNRIKIDVRFAFLSEPYKERACGSD
jgi:hypothetical protein